MLKKSRRNLKKFISSRDLLQDTQALETRQICNETPSVTVMHIYISSPIKRIVEPEKIPKIHENRGTHVMLYPKDKFKVSNCETRLKEDQSALLSWNSMDGWRREQGP